MNRTELPSVCISMLPGLSSLQKWWMLSCSGWMKSWEVTMTSTSSPWAKSWPGCSLQHPPTRQFSSHLGWPSVVTWTHQTPARYFAFYWRFLFWFKLFFQFSNDCSLTNPNLSSKQRLQTCNSCPQYYPWLRDTEGANKFWQRSQ